MSVIRKIWISLFAALSVVLLVIYILSVVFSEKFEYGITGELLFAILLMVALCIATIFERNTKFIYPLIVFVYLAITMFARFFVSAITLRVNPVISWGCIAGMVGSIVMMSVLIGKKKNYDFNRRVCGRGQTEG